MAKTKPAGQQLTVIARAPFHIYYEGTARAVTATNRIGTFDVLPGHADFFSMLRPGKVVITTDDEELSFEITTGIITVRDNEALLFVNM